MNVFNNILIYKKNTFFLLFLYYRVLLFPAVNNFRRFLIHKTVEQFKDLKTFSIGEGDGRRTIICFLEVFER